MLGDPIPSVGFDGWRIYIYPALRMHQQNPQGAWSRTTTGIYVGIKRPSSISDEGKVRGERSSKGPRSRA